MLLWFVSDIDIILHRDNRFDKTIEIFFSCIIYESMR